MSKVFSCFFPYTKKITEEDVKNTGFLQTDSNTSVCEMSYHHVDAVSEKCLQKRIQKLEQEKKALVEIVIYQHESFKKSSMSQVKQCQKGKANNSNYYTDIEKHWSRQQKSKECEENTYEYIDYN